MAVSPNDAKKLIALTRIQKEYSEYLKIIDALVDISSRLSRTGSYNKITILENFFSSLQEMLANEEIEFLCRVLLLELLDNRHWQPKCTVPFNIKTLVEEERSRIRNDVLSEPNGTYGPSTDFFLKDLSIAIGRSIPVHSGIVDTHIKIWRKPLVSGPISQRFNFLKILARKPLGVKYFFQSHLHIPMNKNLTPEGRKRSYELISQLLQNNPDHKGLCGMSWYYDPKVQEISPHLSYLRDRPLSGGAKFFLIGPDSSKGALYKSKKRRELFQNGEYLPRKYMMVWLSRELVTSLQQDS